ncbi:hypothetical protein Tco_1225778 [Tanacetum coccineum]
MDIDLDLTAHHSGISSSQESKLEFTPNQDISNFNMLLYLYVESLKKQLEDQEKEAKERELAPKSDKRLLRSEKGRQRNKSKS